MDALHQPEMTGQSGGLEGQRPLLLSGLALVGERQKFSGAGLFGGAVRAIFAL